ncbi:MAG: hypothetical protein WBV25_04165 [Methylocella sp.]
MNERLRRSRRVLAVQSQLDRLAQWSLIDLQSRAVVLGDQQRGLVRFMSEESLVAGIFSSTMMRRLQTLAEMLATIASEQDLQRGRHLEERRRLHCAEWIVTILESEVRRKEALRQLAEIIETALQRTS